MTPSVQKVELSYIEILKLRTYNGYSESLEGVIWAKSARSKIFLKSWIYTRTLTSIFKMFENLKLQIFEVNFFFHKVQKGPRVRFFFTFLYQHRYVYRCTLPSWLAVNFETCVAYALPYKKDQPFCRRAPCWRRSRICWPAHGLLSESPKICINQSIGL